MDFAACGEILFKARCGAKDFFDKLTPPTRAEFFSSGMHGFGRFRDTAPARPPAKQKVPAKSRDLLFLSEGEEPGAGMARGELRHALLSGGAGRHLCF